MDNTDNIVVGIDVGTTKIAVFVGEKTSEGKIEIIAMGKSASYGVERGVVKNIIKTRDSIIKAVELAEKNYGKKITRAYVGIAGHNLKNTPLKGQRIIKEDNHIITEEDVEDLLEEQYNTSIPQGQHIIDIVPQSYIIDGESGINDPEGRIGKRIECNYNLITGDYNNVRNIYTAVRQANIEVEDLILEPIASAEAVIDKNEKMAGICLVDIGGGTTDMAVFQEGILRHTAVIQLAGSVITMDIKDGCKIMYPQAETLKTKFGDCLQDPEQQAIRISIPGFRGKDQREITLYQLSEIIKARMEMILQQVDYELKTDQYSNMLIAGIVLTGGGSNLAHVADYCEYITGITTRVGGPDLMVNCGADNPYADPMYSTGIGLVIKGFEIEQKKASKQPPIPQEQPQEQEVPQQETQVPEPEPKPIEVTPAPEPKKKHSSASFSEKLGKFVTRILTDKES